MVTKTRYTASHAVRNVGRSAQRSEAAPDLRDPLRADVVYQAYAGRRMNGTRSPTLRAYHNTSTDIRNETPTKCQVVRTHQQSEIPGIFSHLQI